MDGVTTVVVGEHPELQQWLVRRKELGQDRFDEVWEGVHHVAPYEHVRNSIAARRIMNALEARAVVAGLVSVPPFNLGTGPADFRVPDGGWLAADQPLHLCMPTAVEVLEVLSPGDETYAKLPFYAEHGVHEVLVADPVEHRLECRRLLGSSGPQPGSEVFGVDLTGLALALDWP